MLNDCAYNKIKLMHDLSRISWFIEKHCKNDASACEQSGCSDLYKSVQKALDDQIEMLKKTME